MKRYIYVLISLFFFTSMQATNPDLSKWWTNISEGPNDPQIGERDIIPEIFVQDNVIHTSWMINNSTESELIYRRSTNGGLSWSTINNLTAQISDNLNDHLLNTHLAVSGNYVHLAVLTDGGRGEEKLLYFRSTNGGASFEPVRELFVPNTYYLDDLRISSDGPYVNIAFTHSCSGCGLARTPYIFNSTDNGNSFTQKSLPETFTGLIYRYWDFKTVGPNIHFLVMEPVGAWQNYDYNLHMVNSYDQGNSFTNHIITLPDASGNGHPFLLMNENWGYKPKMAFDGNNIVVTWGGYNEMDDNTLFVAVSNDQGRTMNNTMKLVEDISNFQQRFESCMINGDNIYVAYQTSNDKIYYLYSNDLGQSFDGPFELTNAENKSIGKTGNIRMIKDNRTEGVLVLGIGPVIFELMPNGETAKRYYMGNYSYESKVVNLDQSPNGDIHIIHSAGDAWYSTGVFSDRDIFYRCLKNDIHSSDTEDKSIHLATIRNPGDGSGEEKYDNVLIPYQNSLQFTQALSIEFQLKPLPDHNSQRILTQFHRNTWSSNQAYGVQIWYDSHDKEQLVIGILTETGNYIMRSNTPVKAGYWHQVSVVYENNAEPLNFKLYINGELDAAITATGDIINNDLNWYLGSYEDASELDASFDNLRLWDKALTDVEVKNYAFTQVSSAQAGLKCNIDFNTINEFGQVKDNSGYDNHGLLMYKEALEDSTIEKLEASFSYTQQNNTIYLSPEINNVDEIAWSFGDGEFSELRNPSHTYNAFDNYTVCMNVYANQNVGTHCEDIVVRGIDHIFPDKAGNDGGLTLNIFGGGLPQNGIISLQKEGQEDIVALKTTIGEDGDIAAVFDFEDIELGLWDLVVSEGNETLTLEKALTIEESTGSQPWVSFSGGGNILKGRWTPQTLTVGNSGNNDAYGVLLWLAIPDRDDVEMEFVNVNIEKPQYAYDQGYASDLDQIPEYFETEKFFDSPGARKVYPLYIKYLPANSTKNISLRVKTESLDNYQFESFVSPPFYNSPLSTSVQACIAFAAAKALLEAGVDLIPGGSCITGALGIVSKVTDDNPPPPSAFEYIDTEGWPWHLGSALFECAVSLSPAQAVRVVHILGELTINSVNGFQEAENCKRGIWPEPFSIFQILYHGVSSFDPNEKYGPQGYGDMNYIAKTAHLNYKVSFENKEDATAPAHEVLIIDTLDVTNLNLDDFTFGPVNFGDQTLYPRPGEEAFTYDVDLRPEKDVIVRIQGSLDKAKGIVQWKYTSLDPETLDLPFDPLGGFLPPNLTSPEGEGYVNYTVGIKEDIQHGDQVHNSAVIIFDTNDPIFTNEHLSTFDLMAPEAEIINTSEMLNDSTMIMEFDGHDEGAGIRHYEVYVSENDADYYFYGLGTSDTLHFNFIPGIHYDFYALAVDSVGNKELVTDPSPETSLFVSSTRSLVQEDQFNIYPNPVSDIIYLNLELPERQNIKIEIIDMLGRKLYVSKNNQLSEGHNNIKIETDILEPGTYLLSLSSDSKQSVKPFIKQ